MTMELGVPKTAMEDFILGSKRIPLMSNEPLGRVAAFHVHNAGAMVLVPVWGCWVGVVVEPLRQV